MGQKKTIIKLLIALFAIQGCVPKKTDLLEVRFPSEKSKFISEKDKFEKGIFSFDSEFKALKFTNSKNFDFGEKTIYNSIKGGNATYAGQNYIQLLLDKSDKIQGYQVHSYTKGESEEILTLLRNKLGKPNYDDADEQDRHIVWETDNATFVFNIAFQVKINENNTAEANLYVISNKFEKLISYLNSTTHYEAYLAERKKQQKTLSDFSYTEFAHLKKEEGADYYQKGIRGLK